ncbi:MAG: transporter substrate-binding domain-containing protein, partial [Bacillota bacterium]
MRHKKYYKPLLILLIIISLVVFIATLINFNDSKEVKLTNEEKKWIKEHSGEVTIAYTPNYEPVEFLDRSGNYIGMSADYFKLLEQKLNLDFKMVKVDTWDKVLKGAKNKEFYGITAATRTPDRSEYLNFTKPYINNPNVIITKKSIDKKLTLEKLENMDLKVLVIEGYAIIEYLEKNYPDLKFETVKDTKTGIREVSFDQADALIVEIMSASAAIDRDNISNLKLNNETSFESNLSIATRKDMPILNDILNKGLAKISENQKKVIKERWMIFEEKSILENKFFWIILFSILFIITIIIFTIITWNRTLKKNVKQKTKELQESEKRFKALAEYSTDIIMRFDKNYRHLYVNPATKKITDLSLDKFIGKTSRQLDFPNYLSRRLEKSIDKVFNSKYSHNFEFKYKEKWYNLSLMPEFSKINEKKYVSAV